MRYLERYNVSDEEKERLRFEYRCISFFDQGAILVTFEEEKCCKTCKHEDLNGDVYPCSICSINGLYEYWESKVTED